MTLFKLGLLLFWTLWLLIVFLTNLFEWLKVLRIVSPYWKFASSNYQAIVQATGIYQAPEWVAKVLFLGVLIWQCGTLLAFGRALLSMWWYGMWLLGPVMETFAASLGLLAAFILADEIFKQYDLERAHLLLFIAQLLTVLSIYVLPA